MELVGLGSISGVFKTLPFALLGRRLNDLINFVGGNGFTPFTTLPLEIILEILKELDWRSLLKIRLTCKLLNALSRTRDIWINQHHQYVEHGMRSARLEEPLDSYSAPELERWVLMRRSADVGWRCEHTKFSRNRWVSQANVAGTCLVPGGRWLLVGGEDGGVTTYDLDSPTMMGRSLIMRNDQDEPQPIHRIAIDIDLPKQSPNLTFTMALSPAVQFTSPPPLNFHFWQVVLTGHSTEARLTAKYLSSIQVHDTGVIRDIAICKNIFARIHIRQDLFYIEVFDWKQSTSSSHCKAIIFPGVKINAIRLLPGDRLLAFSEDHLLVYSFVTAGEAGVAPPVVALDATEPLWKLSFTGTQIDCGGLSQGLLNETATYFVVHARNLYALIVPHDEHQTPHFYPLVEFDSSKNPMCAIGFEKAFIQHMDRSITRLNFACEKGEASDTGSLPDSVVFRDYPTTHNGARIPKLDEETGRIVQDLRFGFRVVDTALIYMEGVEVEENLLS